jgi:hypothetical protein
MSRPPLFILSVLTLAACGGDYFREVDTLLPRLGASTDRLEFGTVGWGQSASRQVFVTNKGDLPMGINTIELNDDGMTDNWSFTYDFAQVVCPDAEETEETEEEPTEGGTVEVGINAVDTGGWGGDGGGGGGGGSADAVIGAGCYLPLDVTLAPEQVGPIVGSIRVTTVADSPGEDEEALFYADPDNAFYNIFLEGEGERDIPNIYVSPRVLDFGTVWVGSSLSLVVDVSNKGGGELELGAPTLTGCDAGFDIAWGYESGSLLASEALTGVEILFTPTSSSKAECNLNLTSNDPDEPSVNVPMQANVGSDANECAPVVRIVSPDVGFMHLDGQDLSVSFRVEDCNQPSDTIQLSIRSGVLNTENPTLVDTFYAPDESGYVSTKVPRDKLLPGTDTIIVRAVDSAGNVGTDATTVLYRATFPDSDDDGDGFGEDGETAVDCDDTDINTFPGAREIYDGKDNDCDGVIDEGTDGYDDDGDGYSEAEGDCDDNNADVYPGAEEVPDYLDNDCDGLVDEGTTLYDDDGDGYSEAEGDCDDRDPEVHPGAVELCGDGIDNDCNGLLDERDGCVGLSTKPILVGCVQAEFTDIAVGDSTRLLAVGFDADGDALTYTWTQDAKLTARNYNALDTITGTSPVFTAPATLDGNRESETFTVAVQVIDPERQDDYCSIDLTVHAEPVADSIITLVPAEGRCGKSSGLLLFPGLLGLAFLRRRRS